jgi:pyruvate dehydrogenase E1 component
MDTNDDVDSTETSEWLDALKAVQAFRGAERTNYIVNWLAKRDAKVFTCRVH